MYWRKPRNIENKNNALTSLFHRYLDYLYWVYLKKKKVKLWIREGDLDNEILPRSYRVCSLRELLCDNCTINGKEANIFLLRGDKGDGRAFYLEKLIELCYESIQHLIWESAMEDTTKFRFPVLATCSVIEKLYTDVHVEAPVKLDELAAACIMEQLDIQKDTARDLVRILAEELAKRGKLAVFFEQDLCEKNKEILKRLTTQSGTEKQPVAVLFENSNFKPEPWTRFCCIDIGPLTKSQIARYLVSELPTCYSSEEEAERVLNTRDELVGILNKPERLLMYIQVTKKNGLKEEKSISQIYKAFIQMELQKALKCMKSSGNPAEEEKKLRQWLKKRAKNDKAKLQETDMQSMECFRNTEMFNKQDNTFKFEDCKYFLAAENYITLNMSNHKLQENLQKILCSEPVDTLCFFADLLVVSKVAIDRIYNKLILVLNQQEFKDKIDSPALVVAEVLSFTSSFNFMAHEYIKWVVDGLAESTYDSSVYEILLKLNRMYPRDIVTAQLEEVYQKEKNIAKKRRIVYYFGYAKCGLPNQMIDDLCAEENVDLHLKYHIISALIDNYDSVRDKLSEHIFKLNHMLDTHPDPILRSDLEKLYSLSHNGEQWGTGDKQNHCVNELMNRLENGNYWEKAHAAGALSRRVYASEVNASSVIWKMVSILDTELTALSTAGSPDIYRLKTVSYIVEACCLLAGYKEGCRSKALNYLSEQFEKHFEILLDTKVTMEIYYPMQIALSLIAGGLQCLLDEDKTIRKVLGECFSEEDLMGRLDKCLYLIVSNQDCHISNDKITNFKNLFSEDEVERLLEEKHKKNKPIDRRYAFSLVRLSIDKELLGVGFLFLYERNVYAITCRHIVFPHCQDVDISKIRFTLLCQDQLGEYGGVLQYASESVGETEKINDIVIFRLQYFPFLLSRLIYSERDVTSEIEKGDDLQSFGIIRGYERSGYSYKGKYEGSMRGMFFLIKDSKERGMAVDFHGLSGSPIVTSDKRLYGMWQGSNHEEVFGIIMNSILDLIKVSNK